jgi:hypothetical protein
MAILPGTNDEVALEDQRTRVTAPGMVGEATTGKVDLRTSTAQLLHQVVANSGFTATTRVMLTHQTTPRAPVRLTVPRPAPGNNAVLLVHDADGAASWHQPEVPTEAARAFAARAAPARAPAGANAGAAAPNMSFSIPPKRFAVPGGAGPAGAAGAEGAVRHAVQAIAGHFGFHPQVTGLHKVLSVLEYPIEHLVGNTGAEIFCRWEHNKHPYVLRWFPPAKGLPSGEPLTPTNWSELGAGRTLLLIHGIFSSCEGGFGSIDDATWTTLRERYGNRIIGFDHPTACEAPDANAAWFLEQVPQGVHLDLDILCHSRGGLVARSLTKQADTEHISVRNIVFAATPNRGTEITDPAKWSTLINRVTTILTLPARVLPGPVEALPESLPGCWRS